MLYTSELDRLEPRVKSATRELFKAAIDNQQDEFDLLLVLENGFFDEATAKRNLSASKEKRDSPYMIGPGYQYYAEQTQFKFYHHYRLSNTISNDQKKYFKSIKGDQKEVYIHSIGTQLELTIYLKLWESNRFLERLYKLVQLALGNPYPWHFSIGKDDSRQDLIRNKIREPIKRTCPNFYKLIKDIYLSQIRNAVAHSQFLISGLHINFLNYDPSSYAREWFVKIEDWEERFHLLALFYNEYIHCMNVYNKIYVRQAIGKHFGFPLKVTKKDGSSIRSWYRYNDEMESWQWYDSWKQSIKTFHILR